MDFVKLICPKSPYVWEGKGFAECFDNMVFGFGANMITVAVIVVLGIRRRNNCGYKVRRRLLLEKMFFHMVPILGASLSFCEICLLLKQSLQGQAFLHHKWLFRGSQLIAWVITILFLIPKSWSSIFFNRVLCYCWIAKILLEIPHLHSMFLSLETARCFRESCAVFTDVIFGVYINIFRIVQPNSGSRKHNSLEDELLPPNEDVEENRQRESPYNYWHLLTFKPISPVMDLGVTKQLDFEDLIQLPQELDPLYCQTTLLKCWETEQSEHYSHPSLFRAMFRAYGWPYMRLGLLKVVNDGIAFMGPLLLNKLIWFIQQGSAEMDGLVLAMSLGLLSTIKSFLDTQYTFHLSTLRLKLRSGIMTIVYHKCLHINLANRSKFSEGEIQTFMSIDADRTVNLCNSFHDVWSLPLQIGVALYLLYTQVKFAFVSGVALTILLIPVNKWISSLIANATEKMMKQKDERIRRAGELLKYIQTLKMYSWELLFANRLMETRTMEVKHLSTRKYLDAWCVFFWATTPTLFSVLTFGLFALMGHQLNAATVFTCVALFNTLISPLNSFPWVINGLIDAIISSRRLSRFLSCMEFDAILAQQSNESNAVIFNDANFAWSNNLEDVQVATLKNITLTLPKGILIAVIGEVGSGKSSLFNAILREMLLIRGSVHSQGSVAYASQVPWIMSGTVRDNILFGKEYHSIRYHDVLKACALDFDISLMVGGDLAYIGEKGVNLSGGQRARIALARVVYHGSDICMLDDVLSAVDSQVAQWILNNAILSPLMHQTTRILCTHNTQAIASADMIVIMDNGHVQWAGSLADFFQSPYSAPLGNSIPDQSGSMEKKAKNPLDKLKLNLLEGAEVMALQGEPREVTEIEIRKEGQVELTVYKNYARFSGWPIAILICLSASLMQASRNGNDIWLSHWVDSTSRSHNIEPPTFYLVILFTFCVVNSLLTLVRAFSFSFGGLRAAVQVHNKLLSKLIDAPVQFFNQNPSGRILNRLSSDLYMIDDSLPFILNIFLANFFSLLGIAVVLSYVQVMFLLLLLPFGYIYKRLQFYYRSTSRELRRLDSVSRSPIYSSFTETLDGSSTIRAFKAEVFFEARFTEHVRTYQRTSYSELTASLWLSLRLQLLAAFLISFIAIMAVIGRLRRFPVNYGSGTPGLVGLALSYAAPVVSLLSNFLTSFTETEKEMVSVERVLQYMEIAQEEFQGSQSTPSEWPIQGRIVFDHVTLRYMPSSPAALHDISFNIQGNSQVGIVGRTGAGKSSIINALFRITPISGGLILVDDINISNVAVRDLRSKFAVVPQNPFLFEGSIRENLDPYGIASDWKIWEALEKCHMKEEVEAAGGLDAHVKESGMSFSVGQRQLLCLARALLRSSKILCLDECTANVDTQTASVIQNTISSKCKGMTVITIAHRISVVLQMDNILILENGMLVEQGNPQHLLKDKFSRFSAFANASTM
ncbi:ABC transporter C family member 13 [Aristolochia californica]|uniref:ABC transporter C family member 13 n=1 Tax=Aristolochia californica TaxID=171875 RepID=UPI0035DE6E1B